MVVSKTRNQDYEMPDNITTIGPEIQVRGRIDGEEDLKVEGRVEGNIALTETLFVEAEGIVRADIQARDVVVSGIVVGNVTAANSVQLNPGARLVGNISSPRLIIADGAAFAGDVEMGQGEPPVSRERSAATRVPARSSRTSRRETAASAAPSRPTATERSTPRASTPRRETTAPSRAASSSRSSTSRIGRDDDDITVVLKHKDLAKGQSGSRSSSEDTGSVEVETRAPRKKKAKKGVRARMPARGKTRSRKR